MRRWVWLALGAVAFGPMSVGAQASQLGLPPDEVAELVLAADTVGDWSTLLQLAHPYALLDFRETQLRMLEPEPMAFGPMDSCMRGVLQKANFAGQHEAHLRYTLDSVFGVPNVNALRSLRPDTVFARYGRHMSRHPMPPRGDPRAPSLKILGALYGPGQTAYVLVYEHYDSLPFPTWPRERTETMTFRREKGQWRSMLDGPVRFSSGTGVLMLSGQD
jgi:hypothetical protein